jgi:hypothetical protein
LRGAQGRSGYRIDITSEIARQSLAKACESSAESAEVAESGRAVSCAEGRGTYGARPTQGRSAESPHLRHCRKSDSESAASAMDGVAAATRHDRQLLQIDGVLRRRGGKFLIRARTDGGLSGQE